jgi:hypothetical protein
LEKNLNRIAEIINKNMNEEKKELFIPEGWQIIVSTPIPQLQTDEQLFKRFEWAWHNICNDPTVVKDCDSVKTEWKRRHPNSPPFMNAYTDRTTRINGISF